MVTILGQRTFAPSWEKNSTWADARYPFRQSTRLCSAISKEKSPVPPPELVLGNFWDSAPLHICLWEENPQDIRQPRRARTPANHFLFFWSSWSCWELELRRARPGFALCWGPGFEARVVTKVKDPGTWPCDTGTWPRDTGIWYLDPGFGNEKFWLVWRAIRALAVFFEQWWNTPEGRVIAPISRLAINRRSRSSRWKRAARLSAGVYLEWDGPLPVLWLSFHRGMRLLLVVLAIRLVLSFHFNTHTHTHTHARTHTHTSWHQILQKLTWWFKTSRLKSPKRPNSESSDAHKASVQQDVV